MFDLWNLFGGVSSPPVKRGEIGAFPEISYTYLYRISTAVGSANHTELHYRKYDQTR